MLRKCPLWFENITRYCQNRLSIQEEKVTLHHHSGKAGYATGIHTAFYLLIQAAEK